MRLGPPFCLICLVPALSIALWGLLDLPLPGARWVAPLSCLIQFVLSRLFHSLFRVPSAERWKTNPSHIRTARQFPPHPRSRGLKKNKERDKLEYERWSKRLLSRAFLQKKSSSVWAFCSWTKLRKRVSLYSICRRPCCLKSRYTCRPLQTSLKICDSVPTSVLQLWSTTPENKKVGGPPQES